jgi:hypothetical protein
MQSFKENAHTSYNLSAKCPHCQKLTFLQKMNAKEHNRLSLLYNSVLHSIICLHCKKHFGTSGGALVKETCEAG